MRVLITFLFASFVASVSGFGIAPTFKTLPRSSTSLNEVAESELSGEELELKKQCERWSAIKVLPEEEARAQLEGEELQTYLDYHAHIVEDIERMKLIADMIEKDMDKGVGVKPKTKGQRKRDKWARVQAMMD